jgi:hypothetical protein
MPKAIWNGAGRPAALVAFLGIRNPAGPAASLKFLDRYRPVSGISRHQTRGEDYGARRKVQRAQN